MTEEMNLQTLPARLRAARNQLAEQICLLFAQWVQDGVRRTIDHDLDPPYDHSGRIRESVCTRAELLGLYPTLAEWMEQEPTGNSEPTFLSGCGLYWTTYSQEVIDRWNDLVSEQLAATGLSDDELDNFWDGDEGEEVLLMECEVVEEIGKPSTEEIWRRWRDLTQEPPAPMPAWAMDFFSLPGFWVADTARLTLDLGGFENPFVIDLQRDEDRLVFGYHFSHPYLLTLALKKSSLALLISFPAAGWGDFNREIRGYAVRFDETLSARQLSHDELRQTVDPETGEELSKAPAARLVGVEDERLV